MSMNGDQAVKNEITEWELPEGNEKYFARQRRAQKIFGGHKLDMKVFLWLEGHR